MTTDQSVPSPAQAAAVDQPSAAAAEPGTGLRAGTAEPPGPPGLSVTLCRDPDAFAALGPQWNELQDRCRTATPFQTHAWLYSWWLSYGSPGRLRLILVRRGGQLVGVAPLMLERRPLPVLVPLGVGISDFCDVLLDDACADAAADALARGLRRAARTALIDLREVRPGAAAERLFDRWDGPCRRLEDSVCLELPGVPFDDLLARMPSSSARRTRGKLRRIEALGIECRGVAEAEVPATVATMLRLHGLQWRGRGVTPEHLKPRFAEHLVRATTGMVGSGHARLTEFRLGGEVLAVDLTLTSADLAGGYLYGAHPKLRKQADLTTMLLCNDATHVSRTGRSVLSLLRGAEPAKRHWRPVTVTNQRLLFAPRGLAPLLRLHETRMTARARLAHVVRTRAPRLLGWRARLNNWRARAGRTAKR